MKKLLMTCLCLLALTGCASKESDTSESGKASSGAVTSAQIEDNTPEKTDAQDSSALTDLGVNDTAQLSGVRFTLEDASYTNQGQTLTINYRLENQSSNEYTAGVAMKVVADGSKLTPDTNGSSQENLPAGKSTEGTVSYQVNGKPSSVQLIWAPYTISDKQAVFNLPNS